ncbi:MAG: hypothetical protein KVP17_003062 [Porospora cf. gigantea B]|nr:MAG: hypothetical protein KVP17_003062 [Porospora cf. gigantea B]
MVTSTAWKSVSELAGQDQKSAIKMAEYHSSLRQALTPDLLPSYESICSLTPKSIPPGTFVAALVESVKVQLPEGLTEELVGRIQLAQASSEAELDGFFAAQSDQDRLLCAVDVCLQILKTAIEAEWADFVVEVTLLVCSLLGLVRSWAPDEIGLLMNLACLADTRVGGEVVDTIVSRMASLSPEDTACKLCLEMLDKGLDKASRGLFGEGPVVSKVWRGPPTADLAKSWLGRASTLLGQLPSGMVGDRVLSVLSELEGKKVTKATAALYKLCTDSLVRVMDRETYDSSQVTLLRRIHDGLLKSKEVPRLDVQLAKVQLQATLVVYRVILVDELTQGVDDRLEVREWLRKFLNVYNRKLVCHDSSFVAAINQVLIQIVEQALVAGVFIHDLLAPLLLQFLDPSFRPLWGSAFNFVGDMFEIIKGTWRAALESLSGPALKTLEQVFLKEEKTLLAQNMASLDTSSSLNLFQSAQAVLTEIYREFLDGAITLLRCVEVVLPESGDEAAALFKDGQAIKPAIRKAVVASFGVFGVSWALKAVSVRPGCVPFTDEFFVAKSGTWLIPLISSVQNPRISTFSDEIFPIIESVIQVPQSTEFPQASERVRHDLLEALWGLFPTFATAPVDITGDTCQFLVQLIPLMNEPVCQTAIVEGFANLFQSLVELDPNSLFAATNGLQEPCQAPGCMQNFASALLMTLLQQYEALNSLRAKDAAAARLCAVYLRCTSYVAQCCDPAPLKAVIDRVCTVLGDVVRANGCPQGVLAGKGSEYFGALMDFVNVLVSRLSADEAPAYLLSFTDLLQASTTVSGDLHVGRVMCKKAYKLVTTVMHHLCDEAESVDKETILAVSGKLQEVSESTMNICRKQRAAALRALVLLIRKAAQGSQTAALEIIEQLLPRLVPEFLVYLVDMNHGIQEVSDSAIGNLCTILEEMNASFVESFVELVVAGLAGDISAAAPSPMARGAMKALTIVVDRHASALSAQTLLQLLDIGVIQLQRGRDSTRFGSSLRFVRILLRNLPSSVLVDRVPGFVDMVVDSPAARKNFMETRRFVELGIKLLTQDELHKRCQPSSSRLILAVGRNLRRRQSKKPASKEEAEESDEEEMDLSNIPIDDHKEAMIHRLEASQETPSLPALPKKSPGLDRIEKIKEAEKKVKKKGKTGYLIHKDPKTFAMTKAKGDRHVGGVEPYAYVKLNRQMLKSKYRKRAVNSLKI